MIKEKIVIVDFDGTIANISHRLIYDDLGELDWDHCLKPELLEKDRLAKACIPTLNFLKEHGYKIFILTARPHFQKEESITWLEKYAIPYDQLILRDKDDLNFKDNIPFKKREIEKLMKDFDILVAFDDMDDVIELFRSYNIPTFKILRENQKMSWLQADFFVKKLLNGTCLHSEYCIFYHFPVHLEYIEQVCKSKNNENCTQKMSLDSHFEMIPKERHEKEKEIIKDYLKKLEMERKSIE